MICKLSSSEKQMFKNWDSTIIEEPTNNFILRIWTQSLGPWGAGEQARNWLSKAIKNPPHISNNTPKLFILYFNCWVSPKNVPTQHLRFSFGLIFPDYLRFWNTSSRLSILCIYPGSPLQQRTHSPWRTRCDDLWEKIPSRSQTEWTATAQSLGLDRPRLPRTRNMKGNIGVRKSISKSWMLLICTTYVFVYL